MKHTTLKRLFCLLLTAALLAGLCACAVPEMTASQEEQALKLLEEALEENSADIAALDEEAETPPPEALPETPEEMQEAAEAADTQEPDAPAADSPEGIPDDTALPEDGRYTTKDDVALNINTYGHLPDNFITKSEAKKLGWSGGSLEPYSPGSSIGGDRFGNREGLLPDAPGRSYTECDIDTKGKKSRGAKRIVFSNDGLIYYTEDHYETFELLYGEE